MQNQTHLLGSKNFMSLFITQFLGAFNDNVFKNAFLIWFTYDIAIKLNMDAQLMVTIASGLFVLPFFIFSALAGQIADKFEQAKITRIIKFAEIIIMSFSFIGFYFENISLLLTLVFLMGTQSTFFGPIKYSLLPKILQKDELISGNALIEGATFLAILLGTISGSILITTKKGIEFISLAVVLLAIIGYIASILIPKTKINDSKLRISINIFSQTWHIIKYAKTEKTVWFSIIGISWFWFIGLIFLSQFPIYVKNIINGSEFIVTLFLAIFSLGIGVGSTMCNKLLKGEINGRLVPFGAAGISFGILIFYLSSKFYQTPANIIGFFEFISNINGLIISFSLAITSIFSGIYIVPLYTMMQDRSPVKYLSRIIAANNILNAFFMVLASIFIILLAKLGLSILQIFLIIAILNIIIFVFIKKIVKAFKPC